MTALEAAASSVAQTFALWGVAATYKPPSGSLVSCTVLQDSRVQRRPEEFTSKPKTSGWTVRVRKSEVTKPVVNGVFAIDGESYAVTGEPYHEDPDKAVWLCEVA